ncbi:hypothetical protein [Mycolicibacterium vanbaalenii]|nr:hypothetical protein [Mycolicibacterium vanbaalenii]
MLGRMSKEAPQAPRTVMQGIGDWYVVMEWPEGVDDGGPARLTIQPVGDFPIGGLSSTVLRQIDFRAAAEELRKQAEGDEVRAHQHDTMNKWHAERLRAALAEHGPASSEYLTLLASEYLRAVNRGQQKINEFLAAMAGKEASTIRGHLWQARKQEILSSSPGRKGGQLSAAAQDTMRRIEERSAESFFAALESSRERKPQRKR